MLGSRFYQLACIVFLLCSTLGSYAQNSEGTILGHITDSSGAVVPDVQVKITNTATQLTQTTKTSTVGDYVFVNITPGTYNIEAQRTGFKTSQSTKLILNVDATLRQDFALEVGATQQQVTVEAQAQMVQTDNATSGSVIDSKLISALPISGRDFTNLLKLQAGATQVQGSSQLYWAQHGLNNDFTSVSVNGARSESVSYLVDGITDNDQYFSTANNIPNAEAIEEFKVQNGMYGAEFGQGSAQINVALKSGGLQYHGSAYDYVQNDIFQPHSPYYKYQRDVLGYNLPPSLKDNLKQNQYGFSLGGPVWIPKLYDKGKTFFFYSYEAGRRRVSSQGSGLVPTAQERTGDFSDWRDASGNLVPIYDPSTQTGNDPSTRKPFANNRITTPLSPIAKNFLALYPLPNVSQPNMASCAMGNCKNYITPLSFPLDTNNNTFRIDHQFNENNRIYLSTILGDQKYLNPSAMPLSGEIKSQNNRLFALNWQRTITPNMFNEARVGYNWQYWVNGLDSGKVNYGQQIGFQNTPSNPNLWALPILSFGNYAGLGDGNGNWHQKENIYQFVDNLKFIRGRHTVTLGIDVRRYLLNMTAGYSADGSLSFNGAYTGNDPQITQQHPGTPGAGNPIADMLLGNPIGISGPAPGGSDLFNVRGSAWNFFGQDDFRVTPRLTLNLGLRYELPPAFHSVNNSGVALNLANGGSIEWASKSNAAFVNSISGVNPSLTGYTSNNKLTQSNHLNFAPRIGFAWRPLDTDRFVVRGGYGIFYDLQNQWYSLTTYDDISTYVGSAGYPTSSGYTRAAPTTLDSLWAAGSDASYFQIPYWQATPQVNWPKNKSPYNQQWTLDAQYALTPTVLLDVAYVGNHGLHQPGYWYYNAGRMPAVDDSCNRFRTTQEAGQSQPSCLTDPNFVPVLDRANLRNIRSNAYAIANIFSTNYNALQVRLNQRFSHGLNYQLNYTYSRTMDELSAINNIVGSTLTAQNNNCISCEWGPSASDQTHRIVGSGSYELPVGRGLKWSAGKVGDWVVGGWKVAGIFTAASGNPFTVNVTGDASLGQDGVRGDLRRPNQAGNPHGQVYGTGLDTTKYPVAQFKSSLYHQFNPAAYAAPAGNQYGDVTRNSLRGPYYMRGDMTFEKHFSVTERHNLMYRLEIFNLFSTWHGMSQSPSATMSNGNFGSLVNLERDASGHILSEALQSGTRQFWSNSVRKIQMTLKYTF